MFLASIELCARIDDYINYGASPIQKYSVDVLRASKDGIPYNVPFARFEKWQNNSFGFRGPEIALHKPFGKKRIVCLGASESYGLYESPGKEWPAQLQGLLDSSRFEVVNASVVGLNLRKYGQYFNDHVSKFSPDIVVLVINPLFYFTSLERGGASNVSKTSLPPKKVRQLPGLTDDLLNGVRCLPKMKQVFRQAVATSFPSLFKHYQIRSTENQIKQIELQRLRGLKPKEAVPKDYLIRFHNDLTATVASIRSQGADVVLTTYPSLMNRENLDNYPDIFLDNRRFCIELSLLGMIDAFDQFNAVIASVAAERKTMLVDCQVLIPKTTDCFGDNVHYKDDGARVFAESVARQIHNRPKLSATAEVNAVQTFLAVN